MDLDCGWNTLATGLLSLMSRLQSGASDRGKTEDDFEMIFSVVVFFFYDDDMFFFLIVSCIFIVFRCFVLQHSPRWLLRSSYCFIYISMYVCSMRKPLGKKYMNT